MTSLFEDAREEDWASGAPALILAAFSLGTCALLALLACACHRLRTSSKCSTQPAWLADEKASTGQSLPDTQVERLSETADSVVPTEPCADSAKSNEGSSTNDNSEESKLGDTTDSIRMVVPGQVQSEENTPLREKRPPWQAREDGAVKAGASPFREPLAPLSPRPLPPPDPQMAPVRPPRSFSERDKGRRQKGGSHSSSRSKRSLAGEQESRLASSEPAAAPSEVGQHALWAESDIL